MTDDKGAWLSNEWRGPDTAPRATGAATPRSAARRHRDLHLRARPGSRQEERDRAASVLDAGRAVIESAGAAIRDGGPIVTTDLVEIVDGVTASLVRDPLAFPSIAKLRERDQYLYTHSVAMCGWMVALAQAMRLSPEIVRDAGLAGLLHDIGKAVLPPDAAPGEHPERGYDALRDFPDMPDLVLDVVRNHHERADGRGYPRGLSGDDVSLYARMAAICDFYDKATAPPPGTEKWSAAQAVDHLRADTAAFDRQVVRVFLDVVGSFPPGALVRLRSDRIGIVLDESERDPLHPMVAIFRFVAGGDIPPHRMSTKTDPIIGIERPESWRFDDWPALRRTLLALSQ